MARHVRASTVVSAVLIVLMRLDANHDAKGQGNPIRIVTGLRATSQSLGWIGTEAGIFKGHGLEVRFPKMETAGPEAAAGLVRGDWDFAEVGAAPVIQGVLDGHDTVILLAALKPMRKGFVVVRRGITEPGQLNGGRYGVLTEAGQTGLRARALLRGWGITATLVPLGTFPKIYAALAAGEIDAGALSDEYRIAGQRKFGFNALPVEDPAFLPPVLSTTRRLISTKRGLVANAVQGYVESIHLFKTNRSVAVPLLERYLQIFDRKTIEDIYELFSAQFQKLPLPSSAGIQNLLNEFASKYPAAPTLPHTAVADMSFLEELERSGILDRLYGDGKKE